MDFGGNFSLGSCGCFYISLCITDFAMGNINLCESWEISKLPLTVISNVTDEP